MISFGKVSVLFCVCAMCFGCAGIVKNIAYPNSNQIQVFQEKPGFEYTVVGTIGNTDEYLGDLLRDLKIEATKMGGTAIVIVNQTITQTAEDEQKINIMADVIKY